jgi:hypothetical protein
LACSCGYEEQDAKFFKLYYQFIKHAFGLMFCNPDGTDIVRVAVYLDKAWSVAWMFCVNITRALMRPRFTSSRNFNANRI